MKQVSKQALLNLKNRLSGGVTIQTAFEPQMVQIAVSGVSYWMGCQAQSESDALNAGDVKKGVHIGSNCQSDEKPLHQVTFSHDLLVSIYEITFDQWDACVADGGCSYSPDDEGWGRGSRPVINVSWDDITSEYLPWLNRQTGKSYRLLTEAEWEYVSRAGAQTANSVGDEINCGVPGSGDANCDRAVGTTTEVGSYSANNFGLYDIYGNVWEWVEDSYARNYSDAPTDGTAVNKGTNRVFRGGSWVNGTNHLRCVDRGVGFPSYRYCNLGFRVARTI